MEGLRAQISRDMHRLLRRAVLDHCTSEPRRVHPPLVHVGVPGGAEAVLADVEPTYHGLRCDLVAAMLSRTSRGSATPLVWLTRIGPLDVQDVDMRWLASARAAYAEAGLPLVMVVVTRRGWRDPRSGESRTWVKLKRSARRIS